MFLKAASKVPFSFLTNLSLGDFIHFQGLKYHVHSDDFQTSLSSKHDFSQFMYLLSPSSILLLFLTAWRNNLTCSKLHIFIISLLGPGTSYFLFSSRNFLDSTQGFPPLDKPLTPPTPGAPTPSRLLPDGSDLSGLSLSGGGSICFSHWMRCSQGAGAFYIAEGTQPLKASK